MSAQPRFFAIDGLRFFAILAILLYYYFPQRFPGGFLGVDLFLVLAGYFVMASLLKIPSARRGLGLVRYGGRRLYRIGLPMVAMIIWVLAYVSLFEPDLLLNIRSQVFSSLAFVSNLWQIDQGGSYFADFLTPQLFTHLWYLGLQVQCLLLLVLLIFLADQARLSPGRRILLLFGLALFSALLMALLYEPGQDPTRVYYGTDTRAFAFLIGAGLRLLQDQWQEKGFRPLFRGRPALWASLLSLGGILALMVTLGDGDPWTYRGGLLLGAFLGAILMVSLQDESQGLARVFAHPFFVLGGRMSYAIYLWYYPVYILSNLSPLMRRVVVLQWILIFLLAFLTTWLFDRMPAALRKWQAGPEASAKDRRALSNKAGRRLQILLAVTLISSVFAGFGLARAPSGDNPTQAEMEAIMEENRQLIAAGKSKGQIVPQSSAFLLQYVANVDVDFIGDSVLLAAAGPLSASFPQGTIDAEVGRQFSEGRQILEDRLAQGNLASHVVLVLGSNGAIESQDMAAVMDLLQDRQVYLVNSYVPRVWQEDVNASLKEAARTHANCYLINWHDVAANHSEWLYADAIHTNQEGAQGFAALMVRSFYEDRPAQDPYLPTFIHHMANQGV